MQITLNKYFVPGSCEAVPLALNTNQRRGEKARQYQDTLATAGLCTARFFPAGRPAVRCTMVQPVPNAPKNPAAASAAKDAPFEESLKKLESIVEQMEAGELPLETMMARFEEGVHLVKTCQTRLEEAEIKISRLDQDPAGNPIVTPADSLLTNDE